MKTSLTNEERKAHTYISTAELPLHETEGRDWLVARGEAMGFVVTCTNAIPISLSGRAGQEYWDITFYEKGNLDKEAAVNRRIELNPLFREYKAKFRR